MNRKLLIPAAGLALVVLTGCSVTTPEPDQVGISYDAGPFSNTKFQGCINPGVRDVSGPFDTGYVYPAGQRSYEFSTAKDAETTPLTVVSKDNIELTVPGVATFTLTVDCKTLQRFHEQLGLKFRAYEDAGWLKLLGVYVRQPLDRALDAASKEFEWKRLYTGVDKQAWEERVRQLIPQFVKEQGGEGYFTGFSVTLQQPQPPQGVRDALASAQEAIERNVAQKNKNEQIRTEIQSIKELVDVLGWQGYIQLQAIRDGRVQFVLPQGNSVAVPPKAGN
ncbi:SPFH domain-containing protein [Streptosporangium sp. NPDC050855]|uniref:SPFH domain-containing protein n=1 Tax=Streptosporangium sp. NPDC050855 TaxID=3366194 RepID=UPI003790D5C5